MAVILRAPESANSFGERLTNSIPIPDLPDIRHAGTNIYYWRLSHHFARQFPEFMTGSNLAAVCTTERARRFLSEWYSCQSIPMVINELRSFDMNDLFQTSGPGTANGEDLATWKGLMYGKQSIPSSDLSIALRMVAQEISTETNSDYYLCYRIGFLLTLPLSQSHAYLPELLGEFEQAQLSGEMSDPGLLFDLVDLILAIKNELLKQLKSLQEI